MCIEDGRYKQHNIDTIKDDETMTAERCQIKCQERPNCHFWTYDSGMDPDNCFLQDKDAVNDMDPCSTCKRGPKYCPRGKQSQFMHIS